MTKTINSYAKIGAFLIITATLLSLAGFAVFKYSTALKAVGAKKESLIKAAEDHPLTFFAKPVHLTVKERFALETMTRHLTTIGYSNGESADDSRPATFVVNGKSIVVNPRFPSVYKRLNISFANGRISAIKDLSTSEILQNADVESESVGSYVLDMTNEAKVRAANQFVSIAGIKDSNLVRAIVVSEDGSYFQHNGVSYFGLFRAFAKNAYNSIISGSPKRYGGSGITQQVVKLKFLSAERTFQRKLDESFLAAALERYLSKDQILELYLNSVYFGHVADGEFSRGIYGVSSASEYYFGRTPQDLDAAQSATLAAMLDAPGKYASDPNNGVLTERKNGILDLLGESFPDLYPASEIADAKQQKIAFKLSIGNRLDLISQPAVNFAVRQMSNEIATAGQSDNKRGHVVVQTGLDSELMHSNDAVLSRHVRLFADFVRRVTARRDLDFTGSVVGLERSTGQVIFMNSLRFNGQEVVPDNAAFEQVGRDVASCIKPFIYGFGIDQGVIGTDSQIDPLECTAPDGWLPEDSSVSPDTVSNFLVRSKNRAPVCVLNRAGYKKFLEFWSRIRQTKCSETDYKIANGFGSCAGMSTVDLASAYTIFPDGKLRPATMLLRIVRNGEEVRSKQPKYETVLRPTTSSEVTEMMRAIVDEETGGIAGATAGGLKRTAQLPRNIELAGKTGSAPLDVWCVTIHPKFVMAVHLSVVPPDERELDTSKIVSTYTSVPLAADILKEIYRLNPTLLEGKLLHQ